MKRLFTGFGSLLLAVLVMLATLGCSFDESGTTAATTDRAAGEAISEAVTEELSGTASLPKGTLGTTSSFVVEDGEYTAKEEVALYIHLYGKLPSNYMTKKEAEALGWDSSAGNLWEVAYGKSIGGSRFGNYEGLLPEAADRTYCECDIDYAGGYRNAKRIVYSNDGLIFYTEDHYESFEQLY